MIAQLHIQNYALIRQLNLYPLKGFNAITGETGAGKSIIIGALSLILGKRADSSVVDDSLNKCVVEAHFIYPVELQKEFLDFVDYDIEPELIIRREILPSGRSRAFVNDTPVNLTQLSEITRNLVDIHSQHHTLDLTKSAFQLDVVDDFCRISDTVKLFKRDYYVLEKLKTKLEICQKEEAEAKKIYDYQKFLFDELSSAELDTNEQTRLEDEQALHLNAEEIEQGLAGIIFRLNDAEESLLSQLDAEIRELERLGKFSSRLQKASEILSNGKFEIEETVSNLRSIADDVEINPARTEELNLRLDLIYNLQAKHRVNSISELLEIQQDLQTALNNLEDNTTTIKSLEKRIKKDSEKLIIAAKDISKKRKTGSVGFAEALSNLLQSLGMEDAKSELCFTNSSTLSASGFEKVDIRFSANKGSSLKKLSEAASGGELSRVMLSIKSLLNKSNNLSTLIFDEIDSGVSGQVAHQVGKLMQKMSQGRQLIAITHLPQIAAISDTHFKVFKEKNSQKAVSSIKKLSNEDRIAEIAGMLSGEVLSESAISAAKELMKL